MALLLRAILLVVIICLSLVGLAVWLPLGKEGSSWTDLPIVAGIAGAALILAFVWWLAVRRRLGWLLIGWGVLALPLLAHGSTAISLMAARIEGARLADLIRVESYREAPITWPGFDGPIGIELLLDLSHPAEIDAQLYPPEIRMGPELAIGRDVLWSTMTSGGGYFKDYYLDRPVGNLTLLKTVLFQKVFERPRAGDPLYRWVSTVEFDPSGRTQLTYALLPGTIACLPDRNRICLESRSFGIARCADGVKPESGCASPNYSPITDPIYAEGGDLTAIWMAAGSNDMTVDLSGPLTRALRANSGLQANPPDWTAMQKRLEPAGLGRAGYGLCPPGEDSHSASRVCYCRGSQ